MVTKLIKTNEQYEEALARLDHIFHAEPGTPEGDEAELLALLIEDYEETHYPIEAPDPIEAIKIRMEELNLKQVDLAEAFGSRSRTSEVLNRKRKLTLDMVRRLSSALHLPADVLIGEYQLR